VKVFYKAQTCESQFAAFKCMICP